MFFPLRDGAYRANTCYANWAENQVRKTKSYLLQEPAWLLLLSLTHSNIKPELHSVLSPCLLLQGVLHWEIQLHPSWSQSCQQVTWSPLRTTYLKALTRSLLLLIVFPSWVAFLIPMEHVSDYLFSVASWVFELPETGKHVRLLKWCKANSAHTQTDFFPSY